MASSELNEWATAEHALAFLSRIDNLPHRTEGEAALLELLPVTVWRVLDLRTGDGRLLALVKLSRPHAEGVALDFSPTMLTAARQRFASDPTISVLEHNLNQPLPDLGKFEVIVSSFAIHHLTDERKYTLSEEIFAALEAGGVFCNLEQEVPRIVGICSGYTSL